MKHITKQDKERQRFLASKSRDTFTTAEAVELASLTKRIDAAYNRREKYVQRRVDEIVGGCVKALGVPRNKPGDHRSYHLKADVAEALGRRFAPLFGRELQDHNLITRMVDGFVNAVTCPAIQEMLDFLWLNQKEQERSYGDLDLTFTKVLDNKEVRVAILRDHCSCWEINQFIFIEDKEDGKIHIRYYFDDKDSDKKNPNVLPVKLWYNFFAAKNFKAGDYHFYGDIRDDCYILSWSKDNRFRSDRPDKSIIFYEKIQAVEFKLHTMVDEIQSEVVK